MLPRIRQAELMDDPHLDPSLHAEALRGLERLNSFGRSTTELWRQLENLAKSKTLPSIRVLDLATGGGDIPIDLAKRARYMGLPFEFVGADISPIAIICARERAKRENASVSFVQLDILKEEIPLGFDVIMTSLFTHHLDSLQVIALFAKMRTATRHLLLVNDLIRSEVNLVAVWLATRILSKSKIVHHDGPASVHAAYTVDEMKDMAAHAGLDNCFVKHFPPCRQVLVWKKSK